MCDFKSMFGLGSPVFIIAEIGQNHQGDIELAKQLIQVAKDAGANCVKFQKTCLREKFTKSALDRCYSNENSFGGTYGEHKKYLEFSNEEFVELQLFAKKVGILFTASAMDPVSLEFLISLQVPFLKIGSGDANNLIMIESAASAKNLPLLISTGMRTNSEVREIYNTVCKYHKNFVLLHCVSAYPAPYRDVNLKVIKQFQTDFPGIPVGYSGHEVGLHVTLAAVALGAKVIERHLTLHKSFKGSDHKCSLEPDEFRTLVSQIRDVELAMGKPCKMFQDSELACYVKLCKTVVFAKNLKRGTILSLADLKIKVSEPMGVDASKIRLVVGSRLIKDAKIDDPVTNECIEII